MAHKGRELFFACTRVDESAAPRCDVDYRPFDRC